MENARQARLKRRMLMFERRSGRKWHERKNSLQNKFTQARKSRKMIIAEKRKKNKRDRTTLTHDCSTLHSPGTNMDFYALRDIDVDMDHSYEETRLNISTDDTLVEDGFNNCDIPQEIQESKNESGCEEFPSK